MLMAAAAVGVFAAVPTGCGAPQSGTGEEHLEGRG